MYSLSLPGSYSREMRRRPPEVFRRVEFALCFEFKSLEEAFAKLDYNGNGYLSAEEWEQAVTVMPSPATHAILICFRGGRKRASEAFIDENSASCSAARRGAQPLFHALFCVKTLSGTLLGPALNVTRITGLGHGHSRP